MDSQLDLLLKSNASKIDHWKIAINTFNDLFQQDEEVDFETKNNLRENAANALGDISNLFFKHGAFKDTFDNKYMSLNIYGLDVIIRSQKTESIYYFGIDRTRIYLTTQLRYPENIRFMEDSFYWEILNLKVLGEFNLEENGSHPSKLKKMYPKFFNNSKSNIYRLLRNNIVDSTLDEQIREVENFKISWPSDINLTEFITKSSLAFKVLYKLNYELWKVHDFKRTKKSKFS
jgi:hypothetical protein